MICSYVEWLLRISPSPPSVSVAAHVDQYWEGLSALQVACGLLEGNTMLLLHKLKSPQTHILKQLIKKKKKRSYWTEKVLNCAGEEYKIIVSTYHL